MKILATLLALSAFQAACLAADRTVVVPQGTKPFSVKQDVIVRLTASSIAGSQITATLEGPAKIETESNVVEIIDGRPALGRPTREFEIKPSGKGKVKCDITITPPQPGADSIVKHYVFTVE
jgi:hypothetical protein